MGRYTNPGSSTGGVGGTASDMTTDFDSANTTKDADGFLTAYTANNIVYDNITYTDQNGSASEYGGSYKVVSSFRETNQITNEQKTVTVNYSAETGEVTSLSIA